jgi:hypothetical protein
VPTLLPTRSNQTSEIRTNNSSNQTSEIRTNNSSGQTSEIRTNNSSGIASNRAHLNSNTKNKTSIKIKTDSNSTPNRIKAGSKIKIENGSEQHNSKSKSGSNSAPNRIKAGSKIKIDSEQRNSKGNTDSNSASRSSATRMSTSVRVQISNGQLNRGTFGSSVGHTPGIPSTALGSNVAVIAVTVYLTIGSAAPLARITTSEFTANP